MTPERWNKIKQLFDSAIELDGAARGALLKEARLNDTEIGTIVASMIAAHESDPSFLEQPVMCMAEPLEAALGSSSHWSAIREQATKTVADLQAYDGCRLTTVPPDASTVTTLLNACRGTH